MQQKPLDGIRVLDLTQIFQGPYATFLMALAGAEIVKVEPRAGERMRQGVGAKTTLAFAMLNSNKKSLTLDLKHPRGKELLKSMAEKADVLVENFAAGTMDRLGLGYDVMREINPRLIYASGTGYGLTGPDRDLLAMDHTIQAAAGVMSITGEAGGPPARAGGTPCDIMGGIHLHAGVLQALLARNLTGKGTRVETAMVEAMYFTLTSDLGAYHRTGKLPERRGDKTPANTAPYGRYRCKDGWIAVICVSEAQWERVLQVVGREELIGNPDYEGREKRHAREAEINAMIEDWCGGLPRDEAFETLRKNRVPVAPIRTLDDVRADPHMHERGMLNWVDHPDMGEIVLPSTPIRLSEYPPEDLQAFPTIGADSQDVLRDWLALSDAEIAGLQKEEVI
ncbi:MAG: CoA transferase [Alphaproteobacteria bacterium]|nr:CoA transferase [Alphaproteobacteria bacterium]